MSLTWKTPLVLAALLLSVIVATTAVQYRQVRHILLDFEAQRLQGVSSLVARLASQAMAQRMESATAFAREPALRNLLATQTEGAWEEAQMLLRDELRRENQGLALELRGADGNCIASVWREDPDEAELPREAHGCPPGLDGTSTPPPGMTSPIIRWPAGQISYALSVAVGDPGADAATPRQGSLVFRNAVSSEESTRLMAGLVAPDARLVFGNRDGTTGTEGMGDLPSEALDAPVGTLRFQTGGSPRIGAGGLIAGTPWAIWVHRDVPTVLRPAWRTLQAAVLPAVLVLVLGSALGWLVSLRLTRPLLGLTEAAEGLSKGDLERRVSLDRGDELGRLGGAFNSMATAVKQAHDELERRVAERTEDLQQAVAELRKAQAELVVQTRLATLGQLAGGVGHELRNPLGVMTNAVYYLRAVLGDAPTKVTEYLGILETQVEVSKRIVGDLLDYARVRAPQKVAVPADQLFEETLERADVPRNVEVLQDVALGIPPAHVDPHQVGQVLLNLLSNAVQAFDGEPGVILLRALPSADGLIRLSVEDDGPGIPDEVGERIFEPLFTTKARGIGLGLAISRALAEANGGSLSLGVSSSGGGTCLILELPAAPPPIAREGK